MKTDNATLSVAAIKNGSVIDHLAPGTALKVVHILRMDSTAQKMTVGLNLPSKRMGYKDIIKVEERVLSPEELNRVALLAPRATLVIIENFEVVRKFPLVMPCVIEGLVVCPNRQCITHAEKVLSRFRTATIGARVQLSCAYCTKSFFREDIQKYSI